MNWSVAVLRGVARSCVSGLGKCLLALQVGVIGAGVSVPADAAEKDQRNAEREEHRDRRRLRESRGDRGHVTRRNDIIRKESHVEKKHGWREID